MTVLWVTAFKDLNRANWSYSQRTFDYYLERFKRLIEPLGEHLVCFVDEPQASIIRERTGFQNIYPFDEKTTFMHKYTKVFQDIIDSDEYKKQLPDWNWPGFNFAEYGTLNCSKVNFVKRASDMFPNYDHYGWIDFGFAMDDSGTPPKHEVIFHPDKIMISSMRRFHIDENGDPVMGQGWNTTLDGAQKVNWNNPKLMLKNFFPGIHGNMWVCPKKEIAWFERVFEDSIQMHINHGIANHDEPMWLPIIYNFHNKFDIFYKERECCKWWFPKKTNRVLWVTAFIDLKRDQWTVWSRTKSEYFTNFSRISHLKDMICFTDESGVSPSYPFNIDDTFIPKYVPRQREIIENPEFRRCIPVEFQYNPEYNIPEYGILTAAKTCFLRRASELFPDYTHYAWIDFGFAKTPEEAPPLDFSVESLIHKDKILISSHRDFGFDKDGETLIGPYNVKGLLNEKCPWNKLNRNPHLLQGNFFVVPKTLTHWFEKETKRSIEIHHEASIAQAEQNLFLPIIHDFPSRFHINIRLDSDITWINNIVPDMGIHFEKIRKIVDDRWIPGRCGSYLISKESHQYDRSMYSKQKIFIDACRNSTSILEVGFYMGHSALISLLANDKIVYIGVDICEFPFVEDCASYLKDTFTRFNFIKGSSLDVLPTLHKQYDLIHIDGCHSPDTVRREIEIIIANKLSNGYIIFDDYDCIYDLITSDPRLKIIQIAECPHRNALCTLNMENIL